MIFLGFDPGGETGLALLRVSNEMVVQATVASARSVDEAIAWAFQECQTEDPTAAGIDTFLCWSTGPNGWRPMDKHLRATFPGVRDSVFSSNSARGAMAVQGMAMAMRLRAKWPGLHLNETHPKVLYYKLTGTKYTQPDISPMVDWLKQRVGPVLKCIVKNEHQCDALISAWATWKGVSGRLKKDLMLGSESLLCPAGHATYYWPE